MNMMHPAFALEQQGQLPLAMPHDTFLDDAPTQIALTQAARRLSRGSTGQRAATAMRVTKQSSANNSPRSTTAMNRRRTMISDYQRPGRQAQVAEHYLMGSGDYTQAPVRSSRPVSWHPSTQLQPNLSQYQAGAYPLSTPSMHNDYQEAYTQPQFSPMMAAYSNNTSPSSAFSPLPLQTMPAEPVHYFPTQDWEVSHKPLSLYTGMGEGQIYTDSYSAMGSSTQDQLSAHSMDWNTFVTQGFNNTSPPTPELFLPTPQPQTAMAEESIIYHPLDEPEEEGEVLVGMGLYDTPEKYEEDPHLNNYRSTVSSLLGSNFRPREPQGKGLKLEETWEPPKSDDEDEDDNDEEEEEEDQNSESAEVKA